MPDVISDLQATNQNRVDDFMGDEHGEANEMLANFENNANHHTSSLLDLDPMLSAASHHQQMSTVDMSSIDPIITNYGLMSMHHHSNCDRASVDSILQSDSDSLISDIDMIA